MSRTCLQVAHFGIQLNINIYSHCTHINRYYTKISAVSLSAVNYRLFHEDLSAIIKTAFSHETVCK